MKLLIYGAGAIGRYLGGMLDRAGHDVTMIVRPEAVAPIQAEGLMIQDQEGVVATRPQTVTSLRQAMLNNLSYDAFILTMKSYSVTQAIDEMVAFSPLPPPLITLQNGIGIEELLREQFPQTSVIAGTITTPISVKNENRVVVEKRGRGMGLAPTTGVEKIGSWASLFREAGITTVMVKNYQNLKWSKLLLNIIGNASSAILNRHPGVVYQSQAMFALEMKAIREALLVMRRLHLRAVNLPGAPAKWLAYGVKNLPPWLLKPVLTRLVLRGRGDKMPSFALDLTAGKAQSEVLYHNGAVAKAGRELGIPTPVNTAFTDILLKLTRREIEWQTYSGNVKQLVNDINQYS